MANKQYMDIAAARHMRGQELPRDPKPAAGRRADASARAAAPGRAPRSAAEKAHRRKRLIALFLATLVCLTVPTLITLLVLFG